MAVQLHKPVVCPVVIGRANDIAVLHTLIDEAKSGKGQVFLISGEAGIGKSRLVREAKAYASQSMSILQGNCFESDQSYPYAPLVDLLHTFFAAHAQEEFLQTLDAPSDEFIKLLPELESGQPDTSKIQGSDPQQEKRRLFAVLTHFVIHQATKQPLVLIVEDMHWCDDTSLEFLLYLARRTTNKPILMIFTYRNDEVQPSLAHWLAQLERERLAQELTLVKLTHNEVEAMLNAIFQKRYSIRHDVVDSLYNLTEGNPFFIEEILKSLIASGELVFTNNKWVDKPLHELHLPRDIQDAVLQRLARLSETSKQLLTLAAVAGHRFDFALLQQLTQHSEQQLLALMKELIAAQLVIEESAEQFAFRHALTQQAIYTQLLVRERRTLHLAIADALEQLYATTIEHYVEELAYHFYKAEVWEKALTYGQHAGDKAQALYSPRAAIEHYTRALHAAQHMAILPPAALFRRRGQVYETLGDFEHAKDDYAQALDIAQTSHDGEAEWQSDIDLGFLWSERDYEQAGIYYNRAIELARTLANPKLEAHSLNRMGNWHMNIEQPLEALRYHREALMIFEDLHDQHGIAETLDLLGMTSFLGGDLVQGTTYYKQAIALFREQDNRHGLTSSLATIVLNGPTYQTDTMVSASTNSAKVIQDTEQALKIAREIGQRSAEAYALFQLALCLGSQGTYGRALETVQQSLDISEEIEHRQWQTAAHTVFGAIYNSLLAYSQAREHFEQALALVREIGSLFWLRIATGYLASTLISQGELNQAEVVLNAALDPQTPAQTMAQRQMWCAQAELDLARGNPVRALGITDMLIAAEPNLSTGQHALRVSKLRGEAQKALQKPEEAEMELNAALTLTREHEARPMQWRICLILGKLYHDQGRHAEAEQAFVTTRTIVEDLATTITDEALQENFLHHALKLLPQPRSISQAKAAKKAYGGLSAREREVAVFITEGKSNREIADTLVLSERTIESHVSNILLKLDFTSRTQIATWVIEKGLTKETL
ncbi:MAG TPA: AAA family ATPase [Ktedonobacteraceae bacterium]|nr:AAA family ATPase [Ktedonobacteraceae bacterium]